MRTLFLRLLAGALAALIAIQLLGAAWDAFRFDRRVVHERAELMDDKLDWAAARLESVPPEERRHVLDLLRPSLALPLEIVPPGAPRSPRERSVALSDGMRLVARGPGGPPPPPFAWLVAQVLLSVVAFAGVLAYLARPLLRDLEVLERTSRRISQGELGARTGLDTGPVADLGRQFDTMAQRVESMLESQKRLLGAVSHELRTPLARMRFQLEALRDEGNGAQVERLDGELDAIDALLGELLDMARLDEAPLEAADPDGSADTVQAIVGRMRGLSDAALEVEGDGRLPISARDLARIVENLVSNAQRHATSRVRVTLLDGVLAVEDDGPGVAPEHQDQLFEPFYTGDPSRNRSLGGVGLGLALVKRAAERWGASIQVSRAALGGARFEVRWR